MKFYIETERLILRDLLPEDAEGIFELDSNKEVHRYLGNNPITTRQQAQEAIAAIRSQYDEYGIGRWAAIEKSSGDFIGWSGLKFITTVENNHTRFHDVGYRFIPRYWGKGYATESAKATLRYAFETMRLEEVIGTCHEENLASRNALEKCGLRYVEKFKWKNLICDWLLITAKEWSEQKRATTPSI
ncbi:MAG TPA: GNAT family N-acetyltransferase [Flavipsychrobacter sp.]|nr:GNAT family N-acetyltransferase [Flavipsychrobacter sp.]